MRTLTEKELIQMNGGGIWTIIGISAAVVFLIGVFDGYTRPLSCNN